MLLDLSEDPGMRGELEVVRLNQIDDLEIEVFVGLQQVENASLDILAKIVCHVTFVV